MITIRAILEGIVELQGPVRITGESDSTVVLWSCEDFRFLSGDEEEKLEDFIDLEILFIYPECGSVTFEVEIDL
jgi:hypothetical protein